MFVSTQLPSAALVSAWERSALPSPVKSVTTVVRNPLPLVLVVTSEIVSSAASLVAWRRTTSPLAA